MAIYSKKKFLLIPPSQIKSIADAIREDFERDEFEVNVDSLMSGGVDISITKGNLFKAVLGMKTALKVTLIPQTEGVMFDANVGIFGQQVIPTVISMFFFWPVLITQIWGLIEQSSLDDRALSIAEQVCARTPNVGMPSDGMKFCTNCGTKHYASAKFCSNCGAKLE